MSDLSEKPSGDMKKKTGRYVAILLLVTVAAVIAGVIIYGVPAVKTVSEKIIETGNETGNENGNEAGAAEVKTGDGGTGSGGAAESWALPAEEQVSRVEIEANLINLHLVAGDAFHAEWDDAIDDLDFYVSGSTLKIREKGKKKFSISLDLEDIGMNLDAPELILTVPESICLEDLEIDLACGNVDITGVNSRKTEIDAACGNIELKKADLGDMEIQADCGNIDLDQVTGEDTVLEADLGRIAVLESSFRSLTASADCGLIECRRITADSVELDADCGDIEISGDYGSLKADCELGNIDVDTDRPENEVRLDLDVDVGNITVNGKKR